MAARTHYEVLGVPRDADEESVKKAYRKAALDNHPDRNPGDAGAEARFREATDAYSVLSDADRRQAYDLNLSLSEGAGTRNASPPGWPGADFFNRAPPGERRKEAQRNVEDFFPKDFFSDIDFGPRHGDEHGPARGKDVDEKLVLTLEEAVSGCVKEVSVRVPGLTPCHECSGSGCARGTDLVPCGACGGTGARMGYSVGGLRSTGRCPSCGGTRRVPLVACPSCKGKGQVRAVRSVHVRVPAGIDSGQKLRLAGMGGIGGSSPGDLYVEILVSPHKTFRREGLDLHTTVHLSLPEAVRGGRVSVAVLDGRTASVEVPPHVRPGLTCVSVRGHGIRSSMRSEQGDLHVTFQVRLPEVLTPRAQKLMDELMDEVERTTPR